MRNVLSRGLLRSSAASALVIGGEPLKCVWPIVVVSKIYISTAPKNIHFAQSYGEMPNDYQEVYG